MLLTPIPYNRNPEFWSSHTRKTLSSAIALARESAEYVVYVDYKAALDNEMSTGFFMGRLLGTIDSVWFMAQNFDHFVEVLRSGRRWCKVM